MDKKKKRRIKTISKYIGLVGTVAGALWWAFQSGRSLGFIEGELKQRERVIEVQMQMLDMKLEYYKTINELRNNGGDDEK